MTTLRAAFPRLVLTLLVAAVAVWLAFNRDRLDPALIESAIHGLGFAASISLPYRRSFCRTICLARPRWLKTPRSGWGRRALPNAWAPFL